MSVSQSSKKAASESKSVRARQERRRAAAYLLEQVIADRMEPRLAINRWPPADTAEDAEDMSVSVAMQALWYFEADEDRHGQEVFYLDAQLDLLKQMALLLKEDRDLPAYMLGAYSTDHRPSFYYPHKLLDNRLLNTLWFALRNKLRPWWAAWQKVWSSTIS
jgi:hypothetical protein